MKRNQWKNWIKSQHMKRADDFVCSDESGHGGESPHTSADGREDGH